MTDLFGNEGRAPRLSLRPAAPIIALDLFDHAAERAALTSGRPKSQERIELAGAGLRCLCDRPLRLDRKTKRRACEVCG